MLSYCGSALMVVGLRDWLIRNVRDVDTERAFAIANVVDAVLAARVSLRKTLLCTRQMATLLHHRCHKSKRASSL